MWFTTISTRSLDAAFRVPLRALRPSGAINPDDAADFKAVSTLLHVYI